MKSSTIAHVLTGKGVEGFVCDGEAYITVGKAIYDVEDAPAEAREKFLKVVNEVPARRSAYEALAGSQTDDAVITQCIKCMFPVLDGTPDVCDKGKVTTEYHACPRRETCKFKGIGCCTSMMLENGNSLSESQLRILENCHLDDNQIALKLFKSPHTVARHSQDIKIRAGIKNKAEMMELAIKKGLRNN